MQTIELPDNVKHQNSILHYRKAGNSSRHLLLFHGFGQDHSLFEKWIPLFIEDYTIYIFDIFFHGKSTRPDTELTRLEWNEIMDQFLRKERIDRFDMIGFSLGGRFVISTAVSHPGKIDNIVLIAPDGVFESAWYRLATAPFGKRIFRYLMEHPEKFDYWLVLAEKTQLAQSALVRFAKRELCTPENRSKVYRTWIFFKPLKYRNQSVVAHMNDSKIKVNVILGSKDSIIPPHRIKPLFRQIDNSKIEILDLKHHELVEVQHLKNVLTRVLNLKSAKPMSS